MITKPAMQPPKRRFRKWHLAAAASVIVVLALGIGRGLRSNNQEPANQNSVLAAEPLPTPAPVARSPRPARKTSQRPAATQTISNPAEAQTLTESGYRRLQQRDYEGARDDFSRALELDPNNSAAKRGLQLSQGGQAMDTISGILHR